MRLVCLKLQPSLLHNLGLHMRSLTLTLTLTCCWQQAAYVLLAGGSRLHTCCWQVEAGCICVTEMAAGGVHVAGSSWFHTC